jgi:hypothetical protein
MQSYNFLEPKHSRDHVLTAEELKSSWLLPLHPRHQPRSADCLRISPGDPDNDRITGVKERLQLALNSPEYPAIRNTGVRITEGRLLFLREWENRLWYELVGELRSW